jgi:hypothetical protein
VNGSGQSAGGVFRIRRSVIFGQVMNGLPSSRPAAIDQPTLRPLIRVAVDGLFRSSRHVGRLKWITKSPLYEMTALSKVRVPIRRSSEKFDAGAALFQSWNLHPLFQC